MRFSEQEHRVIKNIFKKAYDGRESAFVGDQWHANVMQRIRSLEPIASRKSFFWGVEQFFWRLVPVTCVLILVLATILFKMEVVPDDTVFQLLMNGEEEMTISQLVGV